jgi:hypothetical protein
MFLFSAAACSLYGLFVLISGKFILGRGRYLEGAAARQVGAWWALVFPATTITGYIYVWLHSLLLETEPSRMVAIVLQAVILIVIIIYAQNVAAKHYLQPPSE